MKILAVLAHPNRNSFTGALLDEFTSAVQSVGHSIEIADLYAEGFDPCFSSEDLATYGGQAGTSPEVIAEQNRLIAADAVTFFFPVWWWSMPAILKGWIDRVFINGFAFTYEGEKTVGLLKHEKVAMFCPGACDQGLFRRYGYHAAFQRQIDAGIFGYCGISNVETHIFPDVDANEQARGRYLAHTREAALSFEQTSGLDSSVLR